MTVVAVKNTTPGLCNFCGRKLDDPDDETTRDCGGDCLQCMAVIAEDEDCIAALEAILHERRREGGSIEEPRSGIVVIGTDFARKS